MKIKSIVVVLLLVLGGLAGLSDLGSENAMGTNVSGFINADQTWNLTGSPYIVVGNLYILYLVTLTIEPGVQVRFDGDYFIVVYGNLFANGTESNRIVFTSNSATPYMGDWNRIEADPGGHIEMRYCDVRYGGISLYLHKTDGHVFENSGFYNNVLAIFLNASSNNRFVGNTFSDDMYNAIHLDVSADNNTIANNTFIHCGWCIKMWLSNSNNSVLNNSISDSWVGIFSQTYNHTIANNTIFGNDKGVMVYSFTYNNRIYRNNFLGNNKQVEVYGDKNLWNGTYPTGGNFWSDYEGVDFNGTPSQSVPPPDGFGDSPYVIDQDNRDEYPLMAPSPGAPPAVVWTIEPPSQMNSGTSYEVSWIVAGAQATSHTNVHYSLTESFDTYGETDIESGPPGAFSNSITCDADSRYYYKAHAVINGKDYFSEVVSVECGSLPEIEHTCIENAETSDHVEINATVTGSKALSKVYVNYRSSSRGENLNLYPRGNDVWSAEISTPSELDNISYYIVAEDEDGYSNRTSNCTIVVTLDSTAPAKPADLSVSPGAVRGEFRLGWDRNDDDTVLYNVYRATSRDGEYQKIGVVNQSDCGGGRCTYVDSNLAEGVTYWYKIGAVDEAGNESPLSEAVSATSGDQLWLILAIIIVVAVVIIVALAVVLRRRKRKRMAMERQIPAPISEGQPPQPQPEQRPPQSPPAQPGT